ncbi:MAG: GAF domain-containing protein [Anaerolineae bacterium]|nr:GAF domain-containing protein [Anaerolineae bacterium]
MNQSYDLQSVLRQNQLLTDEIRRRVNQLSAINSVAAMVSQSLDLDATLSVALDSVLQVIPVQAAGISLIDEAAGEWVLRAQRGWKQDFVSNPMRVKLGEGLSGVVLAQDRVVVTGDLQEDDRLAVPAFVKEGVQAMAMAPMHARGRVVGIVSVMNYEPYEFSREQTDVLQAIADQLGVALDNARLYEDTRAKQSRLSAIIDSTADAIIVLDQQYRVTLANSSVESFFSTPPEKMMGKPLAQSTMPLPLRSAILRAIVNTVQERTYFDVQLGSERHVSVSVARVHALEPVVPGQEAESGWVIVIQDITHIRDSERNRVRFVQAAAHDLRNPLGVTLTALDFLQQNFGIQHSSPKVGEVVALALNSIQRMQALIDDLMNLEQVQSKMGSDFSAVNVPDLLERAMLEVQPSIESKQQAFALDLAGDLPVLYGSRLWLNRALVNLLTNANKYTPKGGRIVLRAAFDAAQEEILIEVVDTGIGISPANQKQIFESFYREPKVREDYMGTGLGLSIVKSIVEQHNGRVYVQSEEGQGTTIGMRLPLVTQNVAE